jgi:NADH pyrophosphatase NudC (nudix superfamily)
MQPFPFPQSLMAAFFCEAATHTINVNREEIEEAR